MNPKVEIISLISTQLTVELATNSNNGGSFHPFRFSNRIFRGKEIFLRINEKQQISKFILWYLLTAILLEQKIYPFQILQVQLNVTTRSFSEAYDCVGFTTASIWSGIFVGFIFFLVGGIGLSCIVSIKAPSRFESSRGKQLTFTVQE